MQPVILAEKPSQAKAYAEAFTVKNRHKTHIELARSQLFPQGAIITWGIGHLVELKEPKAYDARWNRWTLGSLPILPERYEFQIAKGKYAQFQAVKKFILGANVVINACDIDREGSNIFYSIFNQTGARNKTIKRLWINSLEIDEIRKGFMNLQDNRKDLLLYEEAKARQISDWLVGMNGSRLYTLLLKAKGYEQVFPIGRVQTPTVYLVYERQKEIETFVSEPFFEAEAQFKAEGGIYKGKAKVRMSKREELVELLNKHTIRPDSPGVVTSVHQKDKRIPPPQLHSLSSLQATANRLWKMSPANVLKTAQNLYEKKLVTYPRTDSRHITTSEFAYLVEQVADYQQLIQQPFPIHSSQPKKRYVDNAKVKEHYAIIPTKKVPTEAALSKLPPNERKLYEEILRTTLAMFHTDYLYTETKVTTDVNQLSFFTTGKTERDIGWKALFPKAKKEKEETLPPLQQNEQVQSKIGIHEGKTTPPKPYTEGQLITLMKTCGKFVEAQEETEILKEVEGLGTEATRSGIIETIKKHGYIQVNKNIVSITDKGRILCEAIEGSLLASPSMTAKWETYLRKIGNGDGAADYFLNNIAKFIDSLIQNVPKQIEAASFQVKSIPSTAKAPKRNVAVATCPACQKGTIVTRKGFYGCTAYKDGCKQTFPGIFLKKKITPTQVKLLCTNGQTNIIKGFVAKSGKKFNAALKLEAGKLVLEFTNSTQKSPTK
ncbi:type IA DNA topoisomerase [Sporosarcina ureilytica]|uniref:DNA topoisomerase n=1 Tax=Sporosarcina ureilytica TaxID=298596 RepID=A0A1D8JC43_9BACL|nr:type IA DNA topoisomerase [Sporosarcina ureilytica]AOV06269.1 DNA topoisomerase III [Sporosarcina ureilytica]